MCGKYGQQDLDHHTNECEFPSNCANCGSDHLIYTRSCESLKLEKEILAIKHKSNVLHPEAWKMLAESKTSAYAQAAQRGKIPHNKYEHIVKRLIRLESAD